MKKEQKMKKTNKENLFDFSKVYISPLILSLLQVTMPLNSVLSYLVRVCVSYLFINTFLQSSNSISFKLNSYSTIFYNVEGDLSNSV